MKSGSLPQGIHGTGIFAYIYYKSQPTLGKYSSPVDNDGSVLTNQDFMERWRGFSLAFKKIVGGFNPFEKTLVKSDHFPR